MLGMDTPVMSIKRCVASQHASGKHCGAHQPADVGTRFCNAFQALRRFSKFEYQDFKCCKMTQVYFLQ